MPFNGRCSYKVGTYNAIGKLIIYPAKINTISTINITGWVKVKIHLKASTLA
nr:hypothetical protein [Mucilaginibacter sp. FT3.2]